MDWTKDMQNATERACNFLDATPASDPSRVIIMDLLDEISSLTYRTEQLLNELDRNRN